MRLARCENVPTAEAPGAARAWVQRRTRGGKRDSAPNRMKLQRLAGREEKVAEEDEDEDDDVEGDTVPAASSGRNAFSAFALLGACP